ncbi:MAG TPA: hypothetical protein VIJ12_01045, partial [Candidatus Baltobacteraceae bacterium]
IAAAARSAGGFPSRAAVVAGVSSIHIKTPIGPVGFDAAGDVRNPIISLYGFKNGQGAFIRQLNLTEK